MEEKQNLLVKAALAARQKAYAPYSGFAVGAALLGKSGRIYTGCNIENAAYSATNCAERTAVFKAVSEGETEFLGIAIAGGHEKAELTDFCPPCGVCRQVLVEFCKADMLVWLVKSEKEIQAYALGELLPAAFTQKDLSDR